MKIDLFATTCFSIETDSFGIVDQQPVAVVPFEDGIAKIENRNKQTIYVVPLDKNIKCYKPNGKDEESLCDALLICARSPQYDFYFVELKDKDKKSVSEGTEQLKTTILIFRSSYNLSCLSKKMAFLANKRHPFYQHGQTELMERFRKETGFRLNICAVIPIK
ncbi:hypothetical protein AGMMS49965_21520 [Bacteroidia bacterium]|nr:hypothetical protein AGMMS49965_21520 [Bacteroidia bacterium]